MLSTVPEAKPGDKVRVRCTVRCEDGREFGTPPEELELEFTVGSGEAIPGLEQAVTGMRAGRSKTVAIPASLAYGPHFDSKVLDVDRRLFPAGENPEPGQHVEMTGHNGVTQLARVTEVSDTRVKLDANHPLAGQQLTLHIHLVNIVAAGTQ